MWNLNLLEVLKLLASIATPLAIAFIGLLINRSIQRQNAIAQRQSSWLTKWADDFLKTATVFNDSATSFMLLYAASEWKVNCNLHRAVEEQALLPNDILPLILALNRGCMEMSKFADFAPLSGRSLEKAAEAILDEANSWMQNKGGNPQVLRQKQLVFNRSARNVHAELLGLKNPKD
jgi:hypothetical protein